MKSILIFMLAALAAGWSAGVERSLYDGIALQVQNRIVSRNEIILMTAQRRQEMRLQNLPQISEEELVGQVVKGLIDDMLLDAEADALGITVAQQELDSETERYKARNGLTSLSFEELLQKLNYTPSEFKKRIVQDLRRNKLISLEVRQKISISEEDLQKEYEKKYKNNILYTARHILRRVPPGATESDKQKSCDEIIYIMEKLKEDSNQWEALALTYSDDPTVKTNKGVLNPFIPDQVMKPFADSVTKLEVNEIDGPVETTFGFHVVQLLKKDSSEGKPYEEVKNELQQLLYQVQLKDRLEEYFQTLSKKYPVAVLDPSLQKFAGRS